MPQICGSTRGLSVFTYVSAREKVCVGGREGVETVLIFKSLEGKQKLFIYIIAKVSV